MSLRKLKPELTEALLTQVSSKHLIHDRPYTVLNIISFIKLYTKLSTSTYRVNRCHKTEIIKSDLKFNDPLVNLIRKMNPAATSIDLEELILYYTDEVK